MRMRLTMSWKGSFSLYIVMEAGAEPKNPPHHLDTSRVIIIIILYLVSAHLSWVLAAGELRALAELWITT